MIRVLVSSVSHCMVYHLESARQQSVRQVNSLLEYKNLVETLVPYRGIPNKLSNSRLLPLGPMSVHRSGLS